MTLNVFVANSEQSVTIIYKNKNESNGFKRIKSTRFVCLLSSFEFLLENVK